MVETMTLSQIDEAIAELMEPQPRVQPKVGDVIYSARKWWRWAEGSGKWYPTKHPTSDMNAAWEVFTSIKERRASIGFKCCHVEFWPTSASGIGRGIDGEFSIAICLAFLKAHGREVEVKDD